VVRQSIRLMTDPPHTVDYGPFIKSQLTLWAVTFKDFLMRIWSRYR
jgi:hypothetical protein